VIGNKRTTPLSIVAQYNLARFAPSFRPRKGLRLSEVCWSTPGLSLGVVFLVWRENGRFSEWNLCHGGLLYDHLCDPNSAFLPAFRGRSGGVVWSREPEVGPAVLSIRSDRTQRPEHGPLTDGFFGNTEGGRGYGSGGRPTN